MDAIVARLQFETQASLALFGTGSVLPVSDEGPFLLDGTKWYVWSAGSGAYVPATVEALDQFNSKPWRANAAAAITIPFPIPGATTVDLAFTEEFDTDGSFDANTFTAQDNGYYVFKAKMAAYVPAPSIVIAPEAVIILFYLKKNGFQLPREQVYTELGNAVVGRTYSIDTILKLNAGDTISVAANISIGVGECSFEITQNESWFSGYKVRNETFDV
jgi:hypothetical protein